MKYLVFLAPLFFSGCAIGSLGSIGSFYSLNAKEADSLSPRAEKELCEKVKKDIQNEHKF